MTAQNQQSLYIASRINSEDNKFEEYDFFYYLVENYPGGDVYFSKWDYSSLNNSPRDGILFYETKRKKNIIHALIPDKSLDSMTKNTSGLKKVKLQKHPKGVIIDGKPYSFRTKGVQQLGTKEPFENLPLYQRVPAVQDLFKTCVEDWEEVITDNLTNCDNIFLSDRDLALANKMIKEVRELIKTTEVKLNNLAMMIK